MAKTMTHPPDRCPRHSNSGNVKSHTTESRSSSICLQHKITQHACAEPGCQEFLGWEYHGPKNAFQGGPGRYEDAAILLTTAEDKHDRETTGDAFTIVILLSILALAAWWPALSLIHDATWTIWHSIACTGTGVVITAITIQSYRAMDKDRPTADSVALSLDKGDKRTPGSPPCNQHTST